MRTVLPLLLGTAILLLAAGGCAGVAPGYEQSARDDLNKTAAAYRPESALPPAVLAPGATSEDYLRFALLHHPEVEAAYARWRAAVASIAPARALPDPKLTFQADIASALTSLMPGLMFDFMSPGKREAMGREAAAGADVAHTRFIAAAQDVARQVRSAWIELAYTEAARRLHGQAAREVSAAIELANAGLATGRGADTVARQIERENELAEHHAHHAMLGDRLQAARTEFKAALGLAPTDPDPPWPNFDLAVEPLPDESELWARIAARNADLAVMRAAVDQTVAGVTVARKAGTPDFSLGAMVDLKANPLMWRPTASVDLPVWRRKIAGQIDAARAREDAANADLAAARLELAARFARALYAVRQADQMLAYVDGTALPNLDRLIAANGADFSSGRGDAGDLVATSTRRILLQLDRLELLRDRADAVTELLFLAADTAPAEITALTP